MTDDTMLGMSTANIPEPPKNVSAWVDLLKKLNDYNLIPLIACGIVGYLYWQSGKDAQIRLDAAEARTRSALAACSSVAREESSKTREVVRTKSTELQTAIGVQSAPAPTPP